MALDPPHSTLLILAIQMVDKINCESPSSKDHPNFKGKLAAINSKISNPNVWNDTQLSSKIEKSMEAYFNEIDPDIKPLSSVTIGGVLDKARNVNRKVSDFSEDLFNQITIWLAGKPYKDWCKELSLDSELTQDPRQPIITRQNVAVVQPVLKDCPQKLKRYQGNWVSYRLEHSSSSIHPDMHKTFVSIAWNPKAEKLELKYKYIENDKRYDVDGEMSIVGEKLVWKYLDKSSKRVVYNTAMVPGLGCEIIGGYLTIESSGIKLGARVMLQMDSFNDPNQSSLSSIEPRATIPFEEIDVAPDTNPERMIYNLLRKLKEKKDFIAFNGGIRSALNELRRTPQSTASSLDNLAKKFGGRGFVGRYKVAGVTQIQASIWFFKESSYDNYLLCYRKSVDSYGNIRKSYSGYMEKVGDKKYLIILWDVSEEDRGHPRYYLLEFAGTEVLALHGLGKADTVESLAFQEILIYDPSIILERPNSSEIMTFQAIGSPPSEIVAYFSDNQQRYLSFGKPIRNLSDLTK